MPSRYKTSKECKCPKFGRISSDAVRKDAIIKSIFNCSE